MADGSRTHAVLTGDIVGSSKLEPAELMALMQRLRDGAEQFARTFPGTVVGRLDVFSGDGWQMLMQDWRRSVRAAIYMRAVAKGDLEIEADTRVAIGWGSVDAETLKPERISASTGEAFLLSGRALKAMKKQDRLAVDCGDVADRGQLLRESLGLVDELTRRWTARQAMTLALALLGEGQAEIADGLGRKQSTIHQSLHTAGWQGIEGLLDSVENRLWRL